MQGKGKLETDRLNESDWQRVSSSDMNPSNSEMEKRNILSEVVLGNIPPDGMITHGYVNLKDRKILSLEV
jgi:hypothetical protein